MIQAIIQPLYYLHRLEVPPWRIRVHSDIPMQPDILFG